MSLAEGVKHGKPYTCRPHTNHSVVIITAEEHTVAQAPQSEYSHRLPVWSFLLFIRFKLKFTFHYNTALYGKLDFDSALFWGTFKNSVIFDQ